MTMALRTETTIESIRAAVALLPKKDQTLPPELEHRRAIGLRLTEIANFHPSTAGLDSLDPDDLDQFLDGYLEAYTRAEAARRMLSSGAQDALKRGYRHHLNTYVPTLLAKLEPIVTTAAATLTDAAKTLPAGDAALDGAAVVEAGATDAGRDRGPGRAHHRRRRPRPQGRPRAEDRPEGRPRSCRDHRPALGHHPHPHGHLQPAARRPPGGGP
jgi:hypothetical protein